MTRQEITIEEEIKARATSLGFPLCGITTPEPPAGYPRFLEWLDRKQHAGMAYLASTYHKDMREDPSRFYPGLRSIIVLGLAYPLSSPGQIKQQEQGLICGYACGEDYHKRIPHMVQPLIDLLNESFPGSISPKVFTDSAPILERELAYRAGLGWIGKNSCLVSPVAGSSFLLAEIFTGIPLQPDAPLDFDHCGTCTRCIEACPTGCIQPDRTINAEQCLSYHSIENRKTIPPDIMDKFTNQVFGCDICQVVCPWNRFSAIDRQLWSLPNLLTIREMQTILLADDQTFNDLYGHSPVARVRLNGLKRNILIFFGNSKCAEVEKTIQELMDNESDAMLLVTARWALEKIKT